MKLIKYNPYRIAGVFSNASAKELGRQRTKMIAFAKVGREVSSDYDLNYLGKISRTNVEYIETAFSNIEQNQGRVNHALFWFLNINAFDNTAIEYLKNGNNEKAIEIWEKVIENREMNSKNFSSFNNLGTLKLLSEHKDDIKEGIEAKVKLIESVYFENFVRAIADETYTIENSKQIERFVDDLIAHFKNQYSRQETIELFNNCNGTAQSYLLQIYAHEPISKIEQQINRVKTIRKENENDLYQIGLNLYLKCIDDLISLKSLLGEEDFKYKLIADNLSKEILQCGINFFNKWNETDDPSKESLELIKYADSIAISTLLKDRITDNRKTIEEWAHASQIPNDIAFINSKLDKFRKVDITVSNAKELLLSCKGRLQSLKVVLGSNNRLYIDTSSSIVKAILEKVLILVENEKQRFKMNETLSQLKKRLEEVNLIMLEITIFAMNYETRKLFEETKLTIDNVSFETSSNTISFLIGIGIGFVVLIAVLRILGLAFT